MYLLGASGCCSPSGLQDSVAARDLAFVKNIAPSVAEPPIADNEAVLSHAELSGHRLHAEAAPTWHQNCRLRVINVLERDVDVLHDANKPKMQCEEENVRTTYLVWLPGTYLALMWLRERSLYTTENSRSPPGST
jgi:hypothetical protein